MSKEDIAALEAMLAELDGADDDSPALPLKEEWKEVRHAQAAMRAKGYASSFRVECVECGVHCMRVEADAAHLALRDYCSTNCIDDALERYREGAAYLHRISDALSTLRDPDKKSAHAEAWSALCAMHDDFLKKLPLKMLHPLPESGTT